LQFVEYILPVFVKTKYTHAYLCVAEADAMNDVMRDLRQLAAELLSADSDSDNGADEDVT